MASILQREDIEDNLGIFTYPEKTRVSRRDSGKRNGGIH
jgi:hypothetical protein